MTLIANTPLARYHAIVEALQSSKDSLDDRYWMRFAAQAAVLSPEEPAAIAAGIRRLGEALLTQADWYQGLSSPARFAVAALLIQHHLPMKALVAEYQRSAALFTAVGLPRRGFAVTMAVLILNLAPEGRALSLGDAQRLKAIYARMRRFHWWITGPADLPACAALAQCPSTAEVVVARVEDIYQQLHAAGMSISHQLHTAASLLTLTGLTAEGSVKRCLALRHQLASRGEVLAPEHYDAIAVLTMLDHDPREVIDRLEATIADLHRDQADLERSAAVAIASDLVFLDLLHLDANLEPLHEASALQARLRTLHAFHIAVAVLISRAGESEIVSEAPPAWPIASV
jgi:hypothetical protein